MKNKKILLILIPSILVAAASVFGFIYILKIIKIKNENTSAILLALEEKMVTKENEKIFSEKIAEVKKMSDSINAYFVDPNNIDTFVVFLESLGTIEGVELVVNNIDIPKDIINILNLKISIKGEFSNVISTIDSLENIPYEINITQIYLNKDMSQEGSNIDSLKIIKTPKWQADISFDIVSII